jgi:hypothetical protein
MTFPSFVSGEVLRAEDMNAVGMWRVAGGTFTNATTVDVTGFSSDYTFYRLVYRARRTDTSGARSATAQWRSSSAPVSSGYYYGAGFANYLGTAGALTNGNNISTMWFVGADSFAVESTMNLDIARLNADSMTWSGNGYYSGAAYNFHYGGAVATSLNVDRLRVTYDGAGVRGSWILFGYKD